MNFPEEESKRSTFGKFPLQRWRERCSLEEYSPTLTAKMPTIRKKGCGQPPYLIQSLYFIRCKMLPDWSYLCRM